jgi:hypothetical protein
MGLSTVVIVVSYFAASLWISNHITHCVREIEEEMDRQM